jgi:hypothetical protein
MIFSVEPLDGSELDRLITSLLNATGAVSRLIESESSDPDLDGLEIIGRCAERIKATLWEFAEHHDDEELSFVTGFLAFSAIVLAEEGGFSDVFDVA